MIITLSHWRGKMNPNLKASFILLVACVAYTLIMYHPVIIASFDDEQFVDGEVFTPVNGSYDFRKFTLTSSNTSNYTTDICCSGYAQLVDDAGNSTINVIEWDKMTYAWRQMENESITKEFERPSRMVDGVKVIDVIVFSKYTLYAAPYYDGETNTLIYIATPSEAETVKMINTLEFRR